MFDNQQKYILSRFILETIKLIIKCCCPFPLTNNKRHERFRCALAHSYVRASHERLPVLYYVRCTRVCRRNHIPGGLLSSVNPCSGNIHSVSHIFGNANLLATPLGPRQRGHTGSHVNLRLLGQCHLANSLHVSPIHARSQQRHARSYRLIAKRSYYTTSPISSCRFRDINIRSAKPMPAKMPVLKISWRDSLRPRNVLMRNHFSSTK